jgi:hypothetical protein
MTLFNAGCLLPLNSLFHAQPLTLSFAIMNRRVFFTFIFLGTTISSAGCLFRRKKKDTLAKPKVYDELGTLQQVSANSITIQTKKGTQTFVMNAATVRGGDFKPGMYVHVYYYKQPNQNLATMVVEKVK